MAGLTPDCVVLVATVRALKYNGGVPKAETRHGEPGSSGEGPAQPAAACRRTSRKVYERARAWWPSTASRTDTEAELQLVREQVPASWASTLPCREVWAKGGEGGIDAGQRGHAGCANSPNDFTFSYELDTPIEEKIERHLSRRSTRRDGVDFTAACREADQGHLTELGYGKLPICMAKTQYSFSDDPTLAGRARRASPSPCANVKVSAGAGFLVALTGEIMTMPGLPKVPAAERIDVDENGKISGLF